MVAPWPFQKLIFDLGLTLAGQSELKIAPANERLRRPATAVSKTAQGGNLPEVLAVNPPGE
jgi:hypothetical protein